MRTLKHFFGGAQSKEETASAYLATLLDFDPVFRGRFLALATVEPPLDGSLDWAVRVEDSRMNAGAVDVTLEWPREDPTTFVMVENKLAASAKQVGQLRKYYLGAVNTWPGRRIVGFYLAPSREVAASEIEEVKGTDEYRARSGGRPNADEVFASAGRATWPRSSADFRARTTGSRRAVSTRSSRPSSTRRSRPTSSEMSSET